MPHKDPEARKAYEKAYRGSHKEEIKAYLKTWRENHKDEIKAYYESHKDERKAYRESHKDERNAYFKAYYEAHSEAKKAHDKAYRDAHLEAKKAYNEAYRAEHATDIICKHCGKHAKQYISSGHKGMFCSPECMRKWHAGPNNGQWRGGISFAPYCPKFTDALKEEVRSRFGRRCFLSGKEENGKKLAVHHCDYLKSQGCQGRRWSLLPLDHGWHIKTNHNRWYWFALLRDYWCYKYLTFHGMDIYEGPDRTAWLWEMYNQDAQT